MRAFCSIDKRDEQGTMFPIIKAYVHHKLPVAFSYYLIFYCLGNDKGLYKNSWHMVI